MRNNWINKIQLRKGFDIYKRDHLGHKQMANEEEPFGLYVTCPLKSKLLFCESMDTRG